MNERKIFRVLHFQSDGLIPNTSTNCATLLETIVIFFSFRQIPQYILVLIDTKYNFRNFMTKLKYRYQRCKSLAIQFDVSHRKLKALFADIQPTKDIRVFSFFFFFIKVLVSTELLCSFSIPVRMSARTKSFASSSFHSNTQWYLAACEFL